MLWLQGLIFTVLVPGVVAFYIPQTLRRGPAPGGWWSLGWILFAAGAAIYTLCLFNFLSAGGTPAIFFTRHIRFLIGEEPAGLVSTGIYRFSRNPMYAGVLLTVFGQALLFASLRVAIYACVASLFFPCIVVFLEEPHLRATRGHDYEVYLRSVPRWLGRG